MSINLYFLIQIILAGFGAGLILLQLLVYIRERQEKSHILCALIILHGVIFCTCEAYISRTDYPAIGPFITRLQHSTIALYPVTLFAFWMVFASAQNFKPKLQTAMAVSTVLLISIWVTPWHLSGQYELSIRNAGSIFALPQWDFTEMGPFVIVQMGVLMLAFAYITIYLLKTRLRYIEKEKKAFIIISILHFVFIVNDIVVWVEGYNMYFLGGVGYLAVYSSLVYLLGVRQRNMYAEINTLNAALEITVEDRTRELEDLNRNLEETVQTRTDELMEKEAQIAQTSKMESLGLLTSGIAHDMNNILMGICGNLQLMKIDELDSRHKQRISNALDSCFKASSLVERLGTFTSQREEKLHLEKFSDIVNLAMMMFKGASSQVQVQFFEPNKKIYGYVETSSFLSMLLNLFINARDAMQNQGTITVSYDLETINENQQMVAGNYIHMMIKDTGGGIPAAAYDKIWNPFFTTKKRGKGTGLGLAMCREIIRNHGGEIWFDSEINMGTTFHILVRAGVPGMDTEYLTVIKDALPENMNIMLVEDRGEPMHVISHYLETFGYTPDTFSHSNQALDAFRAAQSRYDLLLTDYALPGMNGIDLARSCKGIRPEIPVVLFSGNIQGCPDTPYVEGFLKKPFSPLELKNMLINVVAHSN